MKTKKLNNRPKSKARNNGDAVAELCEIIEEGTSPQGIFEAWNANTVCDDPYTVIYHFLEAAKPEYVELEKRYRGLMKKLDNLPEGHRLCMDVDTVAADRRRLELDIFFLAGSLLGMRIAGSPMDEIRKLASSIVARGDRYKPGHLKPPRAGIRG